MHVAYMGWVLNDRFDSHHERRAELDKDRKEKAEARVRVSNCRILIGHFGPPSTRPLYSPGAFLGISRTRYLV